MTNYTNKPKFVNSLAHKLELHGFKAVLCQSDADTTIVKTCLQFQDKPVTVLADDTNILSTFTPHVPLQQQKRDLLKEYDNSKKQRRLMIKTLMK